MSVRDEKSAAAADRDELTEVQTVRAVIRTAFLCWSPAM